MEIKAKLRYLRIAPRKVRLIANLVRGMDVNEAEAQLKFYSQKSTIALLKLLNSAIANAKNSFNLEKKTLFIKEIFVNEGPPFKRWRPASRGRANQIIKRTSHVDLILGAREGFKIEKTIKPISVKKDTEKEKLVQRVDPEVEKQREKIKKVEKHVSQKAPKEIYEKSQSKNVFKKVFRRKSF